ncbi:hypothetical protein [Romboutsia sp. 13368]|uniref:hypothetical protein n=1 Tax=Romboutsia sp. 13368 TaxID=2708053 RepID=UPI0025ECD5E4|nr:hypothetical protein [Romboutsia sp. 13368]
MRVEVIDIGKTRSEAKKDILHKLPLVSKVFQFNNVIGDIKLEYIEFKVLKYEVISKNKNNNLFRRESQKENITILVNTYNGHSESVDKMPITSKKYVSKSCIRKNKINEDDLVSLVKEQIIKKLTDKLKFDSINKVNIEINVLEIKSIYKPYWVADFRGRNIFIDS